MVPIEYMLLKAEVLSFSAGRIPKMAVLLSPIVLKYFLVVSDAI